MPERARSRGEVVVFLPYRGYAALEGAAALAVLAGGGAGALLSGGLGPVATVLLAVAGGTLALLAIVTFLFALRWEHRVEQLFEGDVWVRWRYEPGPWLEYVGSREGAAGCLLPLMIVLFAVPGLVVSILSHVEGRPVGGSLPLNYLLPVGAGALAGAIVGWTARWAAGRTLARMAKLPGDFLAGPAGFYLTGQFCPWITVGQRLERAVLDLESGHLVFTFRQSTGRFETTNEVRLPVPPGREAEAEALVERLAP